MKALIKLISGRYQSNKEFSFQTKKELDLYLTQLHSVDPQGWIIFTIEDDAVVE